MSTMVGRRYGRGTGECAASARAATKIPGVAAAASPLVFLGTSAVLEALQPGYSRIQDTISALVWGPGGWAQTAVFFIFGILLAILALELHRTLQHTRTLDAGIALLMVAGAAFIVMGIFPTGLPGGVPTVGTSIHKYTACAVSVLFPVLGLVLAGAMRYDARWHKLSLYSMAAGVLGMAFTAAGAFAMLTDASWLGAAERVMLGNGLLWVEVAAVYCLVARRVTC